MAYSKRTWRNEEDGAPFTPLAAEHLNHLETQYDQAVAQIPATLPPSGGAGGALSGSFPNPGLNPVAVDNTLSGLLNDDESATSGGVDERIATAIAGITPGGPAGVTSVNTRTGAVTLTKSDVALGNVDNTADSAKPVSTAQATAISTGINDAISNLEIPTSPGSIGAQPAGDYALDGHTHVLADITDYSAGATGITYQDTSGNALTGRSLIIRVNTANGSIDDILVSTGPDSTAPSVPGTPTATAGTAQNTLSWTGSTDNIGVANYRVYRSDAPTTILATVTSLNHTDTTAVVGTAYTYTVDAIDTGGNVSAKSASSNSVTAIAPVITNTVAPTITGTAVEGNVLTSSTGTWSPTQDSVTYQWKRAGTNISGATASTYTLVTADVGNAITVTVTGVKSGYTSASATSTATATVTPVGGTALNNTVAPVISGTPTTGQTLTTTNGTWSATPDSYTYQWKHNGTNISGATGTTYVLQVADEGLAVTCTVTAIKATYTSGSASSNSITPSAASGGSVFVSDTFTEAGGGGLQAHTPEVGGAWSINTATSAGAVTITNNKARHGNTTTTVFTNAATPSDADYSVEADLTVFSLLAGASVGICGRASASAVQYYGLRYSVTSSNWAIIKQSGGVVVTSVAHTPTVGQTYHAKLTMAGSVITGTISGGDLSTPLSLSATESNLVTAGLAGMTFSATTNSSATVGIHIDNFVATN